MSLGESFLTPTKIYVKQLLPLIKSEKNFVKVNDTHITGGDFVENIPRVFPENFGANINSNSWKLSEVFKWLAIYHQVYIYYSLLYMCVYMNYYIKINSVSQLQMNYIEHSIVELVMVLIVPPENENQVINQ